MRAPFAGVVDDVPAKVGEASSPGAPVVRLPQRLDGQNRGRRVGGLRQQHQARRQGPGEHFPTWGATDISSTVRTVSRIINPASRTFSIELRLNGPEAKRLRPNMVATVRIQKLQPAETPPCCPWDLVQRDEQKQLRVRGGAAGPEEGGRQAHHQKPALLYNGNVEVTSGLKPDDQVVSMGYQKPE